MKGSACAVFRAGADRLVRSDKCIAAVKDPIAKGLLQDYARFLDLAADNENSTEIAQTVFMELSCWKLDLLGATQFLSDANQNPDEVTAAVDELSAGVLKGMGKIVVSAIKKAERDLLHVNALVAAYKASLMIPEPVAPLVNATEQGPAEQQQPALSVLETPKSSAVAPEPTGISLKVGDKAMTHAGDDVIILKVNARTYTVKKVEGDGRKRCIPHASVVHEDEVVPAAGTASSKQEAPDAKRARLDAEEKEKEALADALLG